MCAFDVHNKMAAYLLTYLFTYLLTYLGVEGVRFSERFWVRSPGLSTAHYSRCLWLLAGVRSEQRPCGPVKPKPGLRTRHTRADDHQTASSDVL